MLPSRVGLRLLVMFGLLLAGISFVAYLPAVSGKEKTKEARLNQRIEDFVLQDAAGKNWSLHSLAGKKAVVVVFLSVECPMANAYTYPLTELAKACEPNEVAFIGINANPGETLKQIADHAKEFRISFPVFRDEKQVAVKALGADVNSEAFVLDANFVLKYQGRIDDRYSARLKKNARISRHDLQKAIFEVLAGKPVTTPSTQAFGCPILAPDKGAQSSPTQVTFNRDVMPILQNHCQSCHRPGEVGPFALLNYRQAVKWGSDIKDYTHSRKMPPWKPVDSNGLFRDERRLSDKEIATLAQWVDTGMPEGDPKDLPAPRQFLDGWQLGQPDLVLEVKEDMHIAATGKDLFRCVVLPTNLTEDKYVSAVEVRPGNPRVVHHTLNFLDTQGRGRKLAEAWQKEKTQLDGQDKGPGYTNSMSVGFLPDGMLGGWAPGNLPKHLPDGVGMFLPKNSDLVVQVHYHRTGKPEVDRLRLGIHFAKKPVTQPIDVLVLPGAFLAIPPGAERFRVTGRLSTDRDMTLYDVTPHMHMLGKEIKATMTFPDGRTQTLCWIKDWDYNWQETYDLKSPLKLPKGTRIDVEAYFDNSDKNPLNPNSPPKAVRFGEETTDEMCFVFMGVTADKPGGSSGGIQIGIPEIAPAKKTEPKEKK